MSHYTPDRWVCVEFTYGTETIRKILAGWYGGFSAGDSWRLSSGITSVVDRESHWEVTNESGSIYYCGKEAKGLSSYTARVLENWENQASERNEVSIKMIDLQEEYSA